jgi:TP901 family phage tail tape measure protein
MAGRQLKVSVLVDLIDRLTSPLSRVMGRVGALSRRVGILGSAVAAISFATPIAQAAQWDSTIRGIGITAGLSGASLDRMISQTSGRYEALALQVGQSSRDIAAGASTLVAAGMDPNRIEALLPVIGRVATAADASVDDISRTAFALSDSLRVPADQMEKALATLVVAGKAGRFELADMAKYFPALTAQMANLGVTGQEAVTTLAAGLQVAMKGAADPAEAANNMKNFLAKLSTPEVKKNFAKMGVDITGVMQDAVAKGINPIEAVIQKVTKLTGVSAGTIQKAYGTAKKAGLSDAAALAQVEEQIRKIGGADKLGQLFGDQQVLAFLLPMLSNLKEYQQIAGEAAGAGVDSITTDFDSRMGGLEKRMARFTEIGEQLMRRVGAAFATNLGWINDGLDAVIGALDWMDQMAPGSADVIIALVGAFAAIAVVLGVLAPALGIVSAGLGILGAIVGVIFSPFILVIAAIAGAAALIMSDWKTFKPFFERLWNGVKGIFTGALRAIKSLFSGDFAGFKRGMLLAWEGLKTAAAAGWDIIKGVFFSLLDKIKAIDWWGTGIYVLTLLYEGVKYAVGAAISFGQEIADQVKAVDWWGLGNTILGWIGDGLSAALQGVANVGKMIADAITSVDWIGVGATIMTSIWNGMKAIGADLANWFKSLFTFSMPTVPGPGTLDQSMKPGAGATPPPAEGCGDGFKKTNYAPPLGGSNGFRQASAAPTQQVQGRIVVEAAKGTEARVVENGSRNVPIVADRGLMLGRA